jgi:hypothetical protein
MTTKFWYYFIVFQALMITFTGLMALSSDTVTFATVMVSLAVSAL